MRQDGLDGRAQDPRVGIQKKKMLPRAMTEPKIIRTCEAQICRAFDQDYGRKLFRQFVNVSLRGGIIHNNDFEPQVSTIVVNARQTLSKIMDGVPIHDDYGELDVFPHNGGPQARSVRWVHFYRDHAGFPWEFRTGSRIQEGSCRTFRSTRERFWNEFSKTGTRLTARNGTYALADSFA
jgi:hypothetical protein